MKNEHFEIFTFSIKMFRELIFLCFCSTFSSQNLWVFCRRDLSLSEQFLDWILLVWAPIWLPIPSRRPSRGHPKKSLNFGTYLYWFLAVLATPWRAAKSQKNVRTHLGGGPILAPKAAWEENESPGSCFRAFWLPKFVFWQRFLSIFCIFLGFRSSSSIKHRLPNNALPNRFSNHQLAK